MRPTGMTVALVVYWLAGVVGAASLPPDDQYSPQPSSYGRDATRGPRGYSNWLEYNQDPSSGSDPLESKPAITSQTASDLSRERTLRKDSTEQDPDLLSVAPRVSNVAAISVMRNFTRDPEADLNASEERAEISVPSIEDFSQLGDTFQDEGPGSIEVYKLDLNGFDSSLLPEPEKSQPTAASGIKNKIPKKAKEELVFRKGHPIETSGTSLPRIFQQPPSIQDKTIPRISSGPEVEQNLGNPWTATGGYPSQMQTHSDGAKAAKRKKRFSETEGDEFGSRFKDPVYIESTEPVLLRLTPIVLDFEEDPPIGQTYEELDELLKLKSTTTPEPTSKRTNRGDIDPAMENYQRGEAAGEEKLPERGDLGPKSIKDDTGVERSIPGKEFRESQLRGGRARRDTDGEPGLTEGGGENDDTLSSIIGTQSASSKQRSGRKLLAIQYPERHENEARRRHHRKVNEDEKDDEDLWGFAEDDGEISGHEDESDADKLRRIEWERQRRREYERRRLEARERHDPRTREHPSPNDAENSEIERIREEYERQLKEEARERQRLAEENRRREERRRWETEQRRREEERRRVSEESERRRNEEERRNRDPVHSRRREEEERRREWERRRKEEEEERRVRLQDERNNEVPPSPLTRPHYRPDNRSWSHVEEERRREAEERKLKEYIERNRPIDVRRGEDGRWSGEEERRKHVEAQRRREMEEERKRHEEERERRRQIEEHRRREEMREEEERRRRMEEDRRKLMEEERRRDHAREEEDRRRAGGERRQNHTSEIWRREEERRRRLEEERRRNHTSEGRQREEEQRRRLEEERKLQEYVRRNQPVNAPRRNASQERDWQEQRQTIDQARQWEHNREQMSRPKEGRTHGPSAPSNIGQRQSHEDLEELRRQAERDRYEAERRRFLEEGRRREEEYRRQESRKREEERLRLEAARRAEEWTGRGSSPQDSRRPTAHRGEDHSREPGELRRHENSHRIANNSRRNHEEEWRRRAEESERRRQQQQHEERERLRIEHERNAKNNERRRPQYGPNHHRQWNESVRNQDETERRRREEARLSALPVSARIIVRSDETPSRTRPTSPTATSRRPSVSIGSRAGFGNEVDFPAINPNRPGLEAARFPAPATQKPPTKSPSACVWAIVNCCPANNRLTTCFESMGCPGVNWDPNPCRAPVQAAARAQVLSFYETAENDYP